MNAVSTPGYLAIEHPQAVRRVAGLSSGFCWKVQSTSEANIAIITSTAIAATSDQSIAFTLGLVGISVGVSGVALMSPERLESGYRAMRFS